MAIRSLNVSVLGVFCAKTKAFEDADCTRKGYAASVALLRR